MTPLVAGRELDALVAEKVMGWHVYESGRGSLMARQSLPDGEEIEHIIATTHSWETADSWWKRWCATAGIYN